MKNYRVCFIKYETYYVEAEDEDDAIEMACELCDDDVYAWTNPVDEFEVSEI